MSASPSRLPSALSTLSSALSDLDCTYMVVDFSSLFIEGTRLTRELILNGKHDYVTEDDKHDKWAFVPSPSWLFTVCLQLKIWPDQEAIKTLQQRCTIVMSVSRWRKDNYCIGI